MVTFETKVWQNDWEYILKGKYLDEVIKQCHYPFDEKVLIINNVSDRIEVEKYAIKKVKEGVIDSYYFAEDYASEVLDFFKINKESFKGGYYYSIAELVGVYLCKTKYLLHFSSDSFINNNMDGQWIDEAINIFINKNDVIVANPVWNNSFIQAKNESTADIGDFYLGYGFSDQCYLIKTNIFKNKIYNEKNIYSERYPKYGGELFEKRVDSYMRNNRLYRITSKKVNYFHINFRNYSVFNKIWFLKNHLAQINRFGLISFLRLKNG
jgi:hypothetical protein